MSCTGNPAAVEAAGRSATGWLASFTDTSTLSEIICETICCNAGLAFASTNGEKSRFTACTFCRRREPSHFAARLRPGGVIKAPPTKTIVMAANQNGRFAKILPVTRSSLPTANQRPYTSRRKVPGLASPSHFERVFGPVELYLVCLQHGFPKKA